MSQLQLEIGVGHRILTYSKSVEGWRVYLNVAFHEQENPIKIGVVRNVEPDLKVQEFWRSACQKHMDDLQHKRDLDINLTLAVVQDYIDGTEDC